MAAVFTNYHSLYQSTSHVNSLKNQIK